MLAGRQCREELQSDWTLLRVQFGHSLRAMTRLNRILPVAVGVLAAYEFLLVLWMLVSPHTSAQIARVRPLPAALHPRHRELDIASA